MLNELKKISKLLQEINSRLEKLENKDSGVIGIRNNRGTRITRATVNIGGR